MPLETGDRVIFIDPQRKTHDALVTAIHGDPKNNPSINLVWVSDVENDIDNYGRQIKRETSIVHSDNNSALANCWYIPK